MIKLIAAISENRALGKNNSLLWNLPGDLKNFRRMTMGSSVVMGRKTFESIGRPLPGRTNIVITRDSNFSHIGVENAKSFDEAIDLCGCDCFVIGGGQIYDIAINRCDKMYITLVKGEYEADTFFPEISDEWKVTFESDFLKDSDGTEYRFMEYERFCF